MQTADGHVIQVRRVRTGTRGWAGYSVRCRPGTFEWKYGDLSDVRYHAGSHFARIWERAGHGLGHPLSREPQPSGFGGWGGIPDRRARAYDDIIGITRRMGGAATRRLVAYCAEGRTLFDLARACSTTEERLAETLHDDLMSLARAMQFAG